MIPGALARRYARALLGLASNPTARDKYARDIVALAELSKAADENGLTLLVAMSSRRFAASDRKKLLEALGRRVGADAMVIKFLAHAIDKDRIVGLPEIARAYVRLADEAASRVQAEVTSAAPLPPETVDALQAALARASGKTVVMTTKVDPTLLGGVVTKVGSFVLDGSLRSQLSRMRQQLQG
ncbi:MAG: ATP synthase F1 subunit delta [Nannocystaceae bacterium]|nr:ATP synthase F1 subunit delta [Nannocystaceae bacterium]